MKGSWKWKGESETFSLFTYSVRYAAFHECIKFAERAAQLHRHLHTGRHDFGGLIAVAGDADDDRLVARNGAVFNQLYRARERRAAGGLGEDTFGLGDQLHGVENLTVGRHGARPAARTDRREHLETVSRIADRDRPRDRVWFDRIGKLEALFQRLDDRRAAGSLRGVNRRHIPLNQSHFLELTERARDARQ